MTGGDLLVILGQISGFERDTGTRWDFGVRDVGWRVELCGGNRERCRRPRGPDFIDLGQS